MNQNTMHRSRFLWTMLLTITVCCMAADVGHAQEDTSRRTPGVYERLAHPGEATVPVIVMGLGGSGLYDVGESVAIDELLVLAGGTALNTRDSKITIRLYRDGGADRVAVYEERLEDMLVERSSYPELQSGDLMYVEVEPRTRFTWREVLNIVTTAASLTLLALRVRDRF